MTVPQDHLQHRPGNSRRAERRRLWPTYLGITALLLLMLVALSIASGVLAGAKMAAWWVIVPPSVMLLGYLLLLRAAAQADAERREMAGYRTARAAARAAAGVARAPARRPARETAAAPAASVAEAKIITIPAAPEPAEEELYDQYADAKLRAVGD